ncbi:AT-hook motif nuclear-localized protein 14 isoform X2 [Raphanus sativus]|uniref:AT-hook motif nuclear-localized protein n=1 Tax=Raphanus sativus TaxID=3726 RepID=A0A9W3DN74_RAPSA|nr:AT-hook motif nuclear-localized protein 14 isoform X2 [Raphanus sativus]
MEPNERHHHHHQHQHQQQQHHHLTSPYYNPYHHHNPAAPPPTTSTNNGNLTSPPPPPPSTNDGSSSSLSVYPHSVPSSAVTAPIDPVKRKRGRPRKYDTPAQALAAKKLASSASNSSARERREQAAAAAGGVSPPSKSGSRKALSGYVGKTGQSFTPHIVNITPGEDVAQKIILFAEQSKHEICILSASGAISHASLSHIATGTSVSYQGQYEILSLSGSYIRSEHGGKTGGLSICLSSSDGQILGGRVGGLLEAAGPVQVIVGTFKLEKKKDGGNDVKGDDASGSGSLLQSPSGGTESLNVYHPSMESSGRNLNSEHHTMTSSALGGGAHFMMQPPQGMHMTHARPSEWGGTGYDLSGK